MRTLTIRIELSRGQLRSFLALALLCLAAADTASESLTLTTTYPAPFGVYNQIITTGGPSGAASDTTLNRNGGNAVLVPPSNPAGMVGVGTAAPNAKLEVAEGDLYISSAGQGLVVKSPSGNLCRRILVSDDGNISTVAVACP
jgi:hypothetical protein